MGTPTVTPNIGLQIPAFNQANWQVQTNYDWELLDAIFGGSITVPALSVTTLEVTDFTIPNIGTLLASACVQQAPTGSFPGSVYTLQRAPLLIMALYYNGQFQMPGVNYTYLGNVITLNFVTSPVGSLYVIYF